jgi:translation initiation factor IF-3
MLGVLSIQEAQRIANEEGLDLVEVSPNANPPVCKITDFGKYKYELQKKQSANNHVKKTKEIQLNMNIGAHDLEIKVSHAIEFLKSSHNVRFVLKLKGREMQRTEQALIVMEKIGETLKEVSKVIDKPKIFGRKVIALYAHL